MKIDLKYVKAYRNRRGVSGKTFYYYRRDGESIRLPDNPLSAEFHEVYEKTNASFETGQPGVTKPGSVKALVTEFQASPEWKQLAAKTRKSYKAVLDDLVNKFGDLPTLDMSRPFILRWRDKIAQTTPRSADNMVAVVRRLLNWGMDREYLTHNPAQGIKAIHKKAVPHPAWSAAEIDTVLDHPDVSAMVKLAINLGHYTGQRIGDVCAMRWSHIDGDTIAINQAKTGAELLIPAHKDLRAALSDAPKRAVTVLSTDTKGVPVKPDYLQHAVAEACRIAGVKDRTFHGLRKSATIALWECGVPNDDIMAITGHTTEKMLRHYLKGAKQSHRARAAMELWENKKH